MDSSDGFFWGTPAVSSSSGSSVITNSVDGFIQQAEIIAQQQQQQQQPQNLSDTTKTSAIPATSSAPQTAFVQQNNQHATDNEDAKEENTLNSQDGLLPIDIVNPDAIEPKARSYTCRICQVTFPNKSAVTVHSRLHTDHQGKPYRCNFCGKGFSTNFYLKQHERIHSGQKPYKCPMCDHSFKQLSHVQQHVRTHTGVRPYKCHWPGCGKAFLQQSHLKSHEARHTPKPNTGVRPYKCHWPDCGKSFAQLNNLKSHVARHTPGKSKSKSKGANNAAPKTAPETTEDSSNPFSFANNVINQAAAAANIVPVSVVDEEAEIRPYLCPGCSKLYVREATFKKHLEECKTKLQLSISATASALGIEPPPVPSASSAVSDFDASSLLQITGVTMTDSVAGHSNAKRIRVSVKAEDLDAPPPAVRVTLRNDDVQDEVGRAGRPNPHTHIKEEPVADAVNFISRQTIVHDQEFKLPEVISSAAQTMYQVQQQQAGVPSPHNVLSFHMDDAQKQIHLDASGVTLSQPPPASNMILTSADSSQAVSLVSTLPQSSPISLVQTVRSNSEEEAAAKHGQEHSTINQAAIRWQWDQPVPRLNFP